MASDEEPSSQSVKISIASHDTALCIIPPEHAWPALDRLRSLYDKAYMKWPPHVNLVYPFVQPDSLLRAAEAIGDALQDESQGADAVHVCLDSADVFPHKHDNTIFLQDGDEQRTARLKKLRLVALNSIQQAYAHYRMHLTIAQSEDVNSDAHKFLLEKVGLLPTVEWDVQQLSILVRERTQVGGNSSSQMKLWGTIDLRTGAVSKLQSPRGFFEVENGTVSRALEEPTGQMDRLQAQPSLYFDEDLHWWQSYSSADAEDDDVESPSMLAISSYNVLGEFLYPPSHARYPLLIKNLLATRGRADILVLQEVTDDFLSYLLRDERIREAYPFTSHGPPEQSDMEPLPSLLNIVVLSKWAFDWEWVSFRRKHKGSVVAKFHEIGQRDNQGVLRPLVVAGVHLSCGLTDGSVVAKKSDLQNIITYLGKNYQGRPCVLTGDFNIATSSLSISAAVKKQTISPQTAAYLAGFQRMFDEVQLSDAWIVSRAQMTDGSDGAQLAMGLEEIVDGEQGSTYNPLVNEVAASIVGSGSNMRPQRYDRILVRGEDFLTIKKFNTFGMIKEAVGPAGSATSEPSYASDHWGVKCVFSLGAEQSEPDSALQSEVEVQFVKASASLSDVDQLSHCLAELKALPAEADIQARQVAFNLLKKIVLESSGGTQLENRLRASVVLVPVGSYGLGVWTPASDVDCLCIGPFSSQTFFAMTAQRLRRAAGQGVKILRRVQANSGTMLELEILGVKMDLQYCPATHIAERWPDILNVPASDPSWKLSPQTLSKLKAVRDLDYLLRSVPDIVKFRLAHRCIRTWAKSRGIYSAKYGYLGGVQLSIMLARVYKTLVHENGASITVPDILASFFRHYADFNWKDNIVLDPFFHRQLLQYRRTPREPLAILGYYPPGLNTSHAASLPTVRTIAEEFRRAAGMLAEEGATWPSFLGGDAATGTAAAAAAEFLHAFKSYVKIDVQFWGSSLARGTQFAGWLESRCVMVLVDINRRVPGVHARIWPARFDESSQEQQEQQQQQEEEEEEGEDGHQPPREYQGCYLIGLDRLDDAMTRDDMKAAFGTLSAVLQRFEQQIRGDEKYFDAGTSWMSSSIVNRGDLGDLRVDGRDWGEYAPGDDEADEEEEEEEEEGSGPGGAPKPGEEGFPSEWQWKKQQKAKAKEQQGVMAPKLAPGKKFRTAADVMSRLRWDPSLDSSDYIVGYEDRFVGAIEKALDDWKAEQTDEEFIPQHRILYFKRKSDGHVLWERRTRKDEIFGSGA